MKLIEFLRRHRSAGLLLAALALGMLAMAGARGYISEQIAIERERLQPRRDEIEVVVAKRELRRGELVSGETMAVRRIPKEFVAGSAIVPERFDSYVGARLNTALRSGEPLLHAAMDGVDAATFSSKVRQGIRALTVSVDEVNSLSGMLQPGDRIDLHFTARPAMRAGSPPPTELTVPLLQDIQVLATGRHVRPTLDDGSGRGYTAITVEVTPQQAQRLIVAQRSGRLTALLRNREDRAPVTQAALDVNGLLELPAAVRTAARPPLEIIVGGRGPLRSEFAGGLPPLGAAAGALLAGLGAGGATSPGLASGNAALAGPVAPPTAAGGAGVSMGHDTSEVAGQRATGPRSAGAAGAAGGTGGPAGGAPTPGQRPVWPSSLIEQR